MTLKLKTENSIEMAMWLPTQITPLFVFFLGYFCCCSFFSFHMILLLPFVCFECSQSTLRLLLCISNECGLYIFIVTVQIKSLVDCTHTHTKYVYNLIGSDGWSEHTTYCSFATEIRSH